MKKTKPEEKFEQKFDSFFEPELFSGINFDHQSLAVTENSLPLTEGSETQAETLLDRFLKVVKFIFLYIPGAMAIHFVGMAVYFFFLFGLNFSEMFAGLTIGAVVGTFLTMFGIGKMSDLNYLKVPGLIFATSVLISIIFSLVTAFTGLQLTGIYFLLSFPIPIICGYLVKKILDQD